MNRHIAKILSILLIAGLNWAGLSAIGNTLAYFNDIEGARENTLSAGTLDFSLNDTDFNKFIGLDETIFLSSVLTNGGSLGFQYTVETEKISGSDNFCNALQLKAKLNGVKKYDGSLIPFNVGADTTFGTWKFDIEMPVEATDISHGDVCEVDLVFKGWQTDVANYGDGGFFDEERIHIRLTSRMIVLNEFLPRPAGWAYGFDFGKDSSDMPQGEWVELYNNGDTAVDVTGWYLRDSTPGEGNKTLINTDHILAASPTVPARGWLVVYMNKPIYNNTGDTVRLFDSSDTLIDLYFYGEDPDYCYIEPTPGDENSTDTSGTCAGVPPNKSYARIPDGIGYWVDPIPTPGAPNILYYEETIPEVIEEEPIISEGAEEEPCLEIESPNIEEVGVLTPEVAVEELAVEEPIIEEETTIIIEEVLAEPAEEVISEVISEEQPVIEETIIEE